MLALDLNSDFPLKETFMLKVTEPMLKEMKNPKELRAALLSEASRLAKMASDLKTSEASIIKVPHGDRLLEVLRSGKRNQKYSSNEGKSPATFATPNKYSRSPRCNPFRSLLRLQQIFPPLRKLCTRSTVTAN